VSSCVFLCVFIVDKVTLPVFGLFLCVLVLFVSTSASDCQTGLLNDLLCVERDIELLIHL